MTYFKYPRTPHLPYSQGATSDDKTLATEDHLLNTHVLISEKMDGENTSLYSDHWHARSIDSKRHHSRTHLAALHARIAHHIPEGWRICGENLYARHSIAYDTLPAYFLGFAVFDAHNVCLSVPQTQAFLKDLDILMPKVLFEGIYTPKIAKTLLSQMDTRICEGFVVRTHAAFPYEQFGSHVAKFVRSGHVQTDTHWMHQKVTPNTLLEKTPRPIET